MRMENGELPKEWKLRRDKHNIRKSSQVPSVITRKRVARHGCPPRATLSCPSGKSTLCRAPRRVDRMCSSTVSDNANMRIHGRTKCSPAEEKNPLRVPLSAQFLRTSPCYLRFEKTRFTSGCENRRLSAPSEARHPPGLTVCPALPRTAVSVHFRESTLKSIAISRENQ